jgi:parallel beta-helix repeat protein
VKFANGASFIVGNGSPGNLQLVGSSAQPIILTTTAATPVAGSWEGIRFYNQTATASKVQYVTLSYAGQSGFGGIYIDTCSPTIQNTTIQNSAYQGLRVVGTASPVISNSTITANPIGVSIASPATPSL